MNKLKEKVNQAKDKVLPSPSLSRETNTNVVDPFASDSSFEPAKPAPDPNASLMKRANNQLLLALNVTKIKMHQWGFNGKISVAIRLGFVELRMSLEKVLLAQQIDQLEMEVEKLQEQISEDSVGDGERGGKKETESNEGSTDAQEVAEEGHGKYMQNKIGQSVDTMFMGIKSTARKMKTTGYRGTVGASVIIGMFGFELSIGVDIEISDVSTTLDDDETKPGAGVLTVQLLEGHDLLGAPEALPDLYCSFACGYNHAKSKAQSKNSNPIWNEVIRMNANIHDKLRVRLYDQKLLGKNVKFGEQFFSVSSFASGKPVDIVMKDGLAKGEIKMRVAFKFLDTPTNHRLAKEKFGINL